MFGLGINYPARALEEKSSAWLEPARAFAHMKRIGLMDLKNYLMGDITGIMLYFLRFLEYATEI